MSRSRSSPNRVHGDRLWDGQGDVWTSTLGQWADAPAVEALLARGAAAVVHGFDRPFTTLTTAQATALWRHAREHFTVPGRPETVDPDQDGLTYTARIWQREDRQLFGLEVHC